ncbi:hypothetical protein Leryth_009366 [Lithospermum erythrorhizon]|nr:hypothetical protein Leryth_009366 [Lithospermum erythrorhizon]
MHDDRNALPAVQIYLVSKHSAHAREFYSSNRRNQKSGLPPEFDLNVRLGDEVHLAEAIVGIFDDFQI